jgi:hypothetical protein
MAVICQNLGVFYARNTKKFATEHTVHRHQVVKDQQPQRIQEIPRLRVCHWKKEVQ